MDDQRGSIPAEGSQAAVPPPLPPGPNAPWSTQQRVRLEHEWRQLERNFAYHPAVKVTPLGGDPPAQFQVELQCRTLYVQEDGQLGYLDTPAIHIWLPPGYPHEAPVVRPLQAVFHPNVTLESILIPPPWEATRTLVQVIQQVGALLAYLTYDPWNVWNPAAMDWLTANAAYLPTDPDVNFSPTADGEPLERIARHGERTLSELRRQLHDTTEKLLGREDPPTAEQIEEFSQRTRLALNLFMEEDIPEGLRTTAAELNAWAEALPESAPTFEGLRQRHLAAAAALQAAGKLAESRRVLIKELAEFEGLVQIKPSVDPGEAIDQLPELPRMQALASEFRVVVGEAEKRLATVRARLAVLAPPDPRLALSKSLLEQRIEAEMGRVASVTQDAIDKSDSAIETITPTLDRARDELAVFDRVIGWKEYAQLTGKARETVERVRHWGAAGVQAYFVENEGGVFGPFEFEQRLDLGESALAVRNVGRSGIEVFDINSGRRLGRSDTGTVTIKLPGGEPGIRFATTFRVTARCDDLWLQLEYLARQITELTARQVKPMEAPRSKSWASEFLAVLTAPVALEGFVEEARRGAVQWNALVSDLKAVRRYKERLTTQYLLERQAEMIPRFKRRAAEQRQKLDEANVRIADIFSRSQRDLESGLPMIPPRLAKDYETACVRRDNAQEEIARLDDLLELAADQIKPRLASPALYGSDRVPVLSALGQLPEALTSRYEALSDFEMHATIGYLEQELGQKLRPEGPMSGLRPAGGAATTEAPVGRDPDVLFAEEAPEEPAAQSGDEVGWTKRP
jgi:ubiquitin-protein ligase